VLEKRYFKKDEDGRVIETSEEMFWRMARTIAEAERAYDPDADVEATAGSLPLAWREAAILYHALP
jgi:ribonucleoside-diphosphate reductase alpha chain